MFIFPTLLSDFKDPIQNKDRGSTLCAELHIAYDPSIHLLNQYSQYSVKLVQFHVGAILQDLIVIYIVVVRMGEGGGDVPREFD